jgi:hypothetical protein
MRVSVIILGKWSKRYFNVMCGLNFTIEYRGWQRLSLTYVAWGHKCGQKWFSASKQVPQKKSFQKTLLKATCKTDCDEFLSLQTIGFSVDHETVYNRPSLAAISVLLLSISSAATCSLQPTSRRWTCGGSRATGVREAVHLPYPRTRRCQRTWVNGNSAGAFLRAVDLTLTVPRSECRAVKGGGWNIVRLVAPWCFLSAISVTHVPWWRSEGFWLCRNSGWSFVRLSFHVDRDSRPLCHRDVNVFIDVRIEIRVDHSSHPVLVNCQNEQLVYKNWKRNWSKLNGGISSTVINRSDCILFPKSA